MKKRRALTAAACLILSVAPMEAHHSFSAEFDVQKPVRLDGVIARLVWENPHALILVDVKTPDGGVIRWEIEAASPNALLSRGVTKVTLAEGTRCIVEGYQAKSGAHRAMGRDILLPNGHKLFLISPLTISR